MHATSPTPIRLQEWYQIGKNNTAMQLWIHPSEFHWTSAPVPKRILLYQNSPATRQTSNDSVTWSFQCSGLNMYVYLTVLWLKWMKNNFMYFSLPCKQHQQELPIYIIRTLQAFYVIRDVEPYLPYVLYLCFMLLLAVAFREAARYKIQGKISPAKYTKPQLTSL